MPKIELVNLHITNTISEHVGHVFPVRFINPIEAIYLIWQKSYNIVKSPLNLMDSRMVRIVLV